jgi:hypothetical protein
MSETVISVANINWVKYKAQVRLSELGLSTADLFTRGKTSDAKTDLAFRLHAYLRASEYVDLFDEHDVIPMLECMVGDETTSDLATFSPILATEPCIVFPGCAASDENSQVITETFTGDGSTDTFSLLYTPTAMVAVSVGGLVYLPGIHYTYSSSSLTFSIAPYSGAEILIIYLRGGVTVSSGGLTDGDKGDIVVSSGGTVWTIDTDAVTTSKILDAAITTSKILDAAITAAKLDSDSVTTAKIQDGAVTFTKMFWNSLVESGDALYITEQSTSNATGSTLTIDFEDTGNNPIIDFASHSGAITINFTNGSNGQSGFIRIIKGANSVTPTFQYGGVTGDFLFADGESFDESALNDGQEQLMGYYISGNDLFVTGLSGIYK